MPVINLTVLFKTLNIFLLLIEFPHKITAYDKMEWKETKLTKFGLMCLNAVKQFCNNLGGYIIVLNR